LQKCNNSAEGAGDSGLQPAGNPCSVLLLNATAHLLLAKVELGGLPAEGGTHGRLLGYLVADCIVRRGSVKDIYLGERPPSRPEMPFGKPSRKGLSPLLAIIIGLVVTIVAGILLAQLYFSYAATISARPAANIEYADLVVSGTSGVLAINIKNTGTLPINGGSITKMEGTGTLTTCTILPIPPGATRGVTCSVSGITAGQNMTLSVTINFADGGSQVYAVVVRARSA